MSTVQALLKVCIDDLLDEVTARFALFVPLAGRVRFG
jgi:hypothetical protein